MKTVNGPQRMDAVTGRYCLKQINRAEGRDLRLYVSKLFRISSVGLWSTCLLTCTNCPPKILLRRDGVLPLPAPAQQTQHAEAGGEERESGRERDFAKERLNLATRG